MNDKIKSQHLSRKAVLYIRQSSAYQVANNLESQKLQYGMRDRIEQLGWKNIEVSGVKPNRFARYCCVRCLDTGEPKCIAFGAAVVDAKISQEILRVVTPSAIEASRLAMKKLTEQVDEVLIALQQDLQAAQYQASVCRQAVRCG